MKSWAACSVANRSFSPVVQMPARFALNRGGARSRSSSFTAGEDAIASDYTQKMLHLSWHPEANVIATAASNSLYLFYVSGFWERYWH